MEHQSIQPGENHTPYQWIVKDEAEREKLTPVAGDIDKVCLQRSDKTLWRLTGVQPYTWEPEHTHEASDVRADDGAAGAVWNTVSGFIAKIISSAGSSVIGFIQSGIGAARRPVEDKLRESISVKDFGAVGDGVTDDVVAFQRAIDYACSMKKAVFIPGTTKHYRLSDTLDLTSGAGLEHNGAVLTGESMYNTQLHFDQGVFTAIEMQGSDAVILENFSVYGPLSYGLVTGRASGRPWGGNHTYKNVAVYCDPDLTRNGTLGSIAFGNFEGEESNYTDCEFWADIPMVVCAPNDIKIKSFNSTCDYVGTVSAPTYTGIKQPLVTGAISNTVYHFSACRFVAWTYQSPCVMLSSCSDIDFSNSFFQARRGESVSTYPFARNPFFLDLFNVYHINRLGTGESATPSGWNRGDFSITGTLEGAVINAATGYKSAAGGNNVPLIYVCDSGTGGGHISGCAINYKLPGDTDQLLCKYTNISGDSGVNIGFSNTDITTNGTSGLAGFPQKLLFNSQGVSIKTLNTSYNGDGLVTKTRHRRDFNVQKMDIASGAASGVVRITLPPSGSSTGSMRLRGSLIANPFFTSNYVAIIPFDVVVGWSRNGSTLGLVASVSHASIGNAVATDAAQITMADPVFSAVLGGQAYFDITVAPSISGAQSGTASAGIFADAEMVASYGFAGTTATVTML